MILTTTAERTLIQMPGVRSLVNHVRDLLESTVHDFTVLPGSGEFITEATGGYMSGNLLHATRSGRTNMGVKYAAAASDFEEIASHMQTALSQGESVNVSAGLAGIEPLAANHIQRIRDGAANLRLAERLVESGQQGPPWVTAAHHASFDSFNALNRLM